MKIGIVCDTYLPRVGGLELHLRDLARQLAMRGHEVHIVCAVPGPREQIVDGVRVHRLDVPLMPFLRSIRSTEALVPMEQIFRRARFDVIHTHNAYSPLAHAGAYLARQLGIPCLFTECSVLRGAGARFFNLLNRAVPWASWPTLLSGVSTFVAEDVRRASGRDEVFTLHNGIDPAEWAVVRREPERPRITSVMRFTLRKRPWDVVRLIPKVHARLPEPLRPRFTLVGDGRQMRRVQFEARRLGVSEHLELTGFLGRDRIREILGRSTAFVLPTRKEAMSIASVEAMATGCPVVAMGLGGVGDVLTHGREGLLAHTEDELVDHVVRLVQDSALRREMSRHAPERVSRFNWDRAIQRHLNLFELAAARLHKRPEPALDEYCDRIEIAREPIAASG